MAKLRMNNWDLVGALELKKQELKTSQDEVFKLRAELYAVQQQLTHLRADFEVQLKRRVDVSMR